MSGGNGKQKMEVGESSNSSTFQQFDLDLNDLESSYSKLLADIRKEMELIVKSEYDKQPKLRRLPLRAAGKIYTPSKGVFLVHMKMDGQKVTLLFQWSDLYFMSFLVGEQWYYFKDFSPEDLPPASVVHYKKKMELNVSGNYNHLGGFEIVMGHKVFVRAFNSLKDVRKLLKTGKGLDTLLGALGVPIIGISEALRFLPYQNWLKANLALLIYGQIPKEYSQYFKLWSKMSKDYTNGTTKSGFTPQQLQQALYVLLRSQVKELQLTWAGNTGAEYINKKRLAPRTIRHNPQAEASPRLEASPRPAASPKPSPRPEASKQQSSMDDAKMFGALPSKPSAEFPNAARWHDTAAASHALRFPGKASGVNLSAAGSSSAPAEASKYMLRSQVSQVPELPLTWGGNTGAECVNQKGTAARRRRHKGQHEVSKFPGKASGVNLSAAGSSSAPAEASKVVLFGSFMEDETKLFQGQPGTSNTESLEKEMEIESVTSLNMETFQNKPLLPHGLKNTGNICFLNASLQAFLSCSPFVQLLQDLRTRNIPKVGYPTLYAFVELISQLDVLDESTMNKNEKVIMVSGKAVNPSMFDQVLRNFTPDVPVGTFSRPRQEDAQEFLSFAMDRIHDELLKLNGNGLNSKEGMVVSSSDDDAWEIVGRKNKSAIMRTQSFVPSELSDIFGGQLQSTVKAAGEKPSATVQPFLLLHLDIFPDAIQTLDDALHMFSSPESLEGYRTTAGKGGVVPARKIDKIHKLPKIMILHLKRFSYGNFGCKKLYKRLHFPLELVLNRCLLSSPSSEGRRYELVATITHHGTGPYCGHYTADAKHADGQWLRFDDNNVSPVNVNQVLQGKAYVLFYKQV